MTIPNVNHLTTPMPFTVPIPKVRYLTQADYQPTHEAMLQRTLARIDDKKAGIDTPDELWVVDHNDVYTLGQAGKPEHILARNDTPIIQTDRGGQVTWHGHGQLVVYWLFDLNALDWKVRDLVSHAEQAIEDVVNGYLATATMSANASKPNVNKPNVNNLVAKARQDAPGVYIYQQQQDGTLGEMLGKIASLGFKIKHGFSYHGIALNVSCDLSAFHLINPCGYAGMQMLRLADLIPMGDGQADDGRINDSQVSQNLIHAITQRHQGQVALRQ